MLYYGERKKFQLKMEPELTNMFNIRIVLNNQMPPNARLTFVVELVDIDSIIMLQIKTLQQN